MKILRQITGMMVFGFLALTWNSQDAAACNVGWSWDYVDHYLIISSDNSWDVKVTIKNDITSDRNIYLSPYSIDSGYYYEGFFEFHNNSDSIANTPIIPGEAVQFNLGTWAPVNPDASAPYANIHAQPKLIGVYYYQNDSLKIESYTNANSPMVVTIFDGINIEPYDPGNPGQGLIVGPANPPGNIYAPIPSSVWLLGCGLFGIFTMIRKHS